MAVAFDACSESHTGTTGNASAASFTWDHTPAGTPAGVLVFTFVNANADDATSVTYGGTSLTAVSGGRAIDSAGEPRDCKAWFLGTGILTGTRAVVVNRNNNANVMYAICITVTADRDTRCVGTPALIQTDASLTEQAVDSQSQSALRFAAVNSALNAVPGAGASSTATSMQSIDFGTNVAASVRESSAGTGSRSVGFSAGSDDQAAVHVAIAEVVAMAMPVGTATADGYAPTVNVPTSLSPGVGDAVAAGLAAAILLGSTIAMPVGTADAVGYAPAIPTLEVQLRQGTSTTIATRTFRPTSTLASSTITLTGGEKSSVTDWTDLRLRFIANGVQTDVTWAYLNGPQSDALAMPVGTASADGLAASINLTVPMPVGTAAADGAAASLTFAVNIAIPVGTATAEGYAASISGAMVIAPPTGAATAEGYAASLPAINIAVPVGTADAAGLVVSFNYGIGPQTGTAQARSAGTSVEFSRANRARAGYSRSLYTGLAQGTASLNLTVRHVVGTATGDGYALTISGGATIDIPTGTAAAAGHAATLSLSMAMPVGTADATGTTASVVTQYRIALPTGTATAEGYAATLTAAVQGFVPTILIQARDDGTIERAARDDGTITLTVSESVAVEV